MYHMNKNSVIKMIAVNFKKGIEINKLLVCNDASLHFVMLKTTCKLSNQNTQDVKMLQL